MHASTPINGFFLSASCFTRHPDPSAILKGNSMGGSIATTSYRLKCEIDSYSYILTKYDISKQIH